MTENRYGGVVFEGVCSDLSNAAYPVDEVRRAVEPSFEPPWVDSAVHLGLTLLHNGFIVRHDDGSFSLTDEAREAKRKEKLVVEVCKTVEPRVRDGEEKDAATFVEFVRQVIESLTDREGKV